MPATAVHVQHLVFKLNEMHGKPNLEFTRDEDGKWIPVPGVWFLESTGVYAEPVLYCMGPDGEPVEVDREDSFDDLFKFLQACIRWGIAPHGFEGGDPMPGIYAENAAALLDEMRAGRASDEETVADFLSNLMHLKGPQWLHERVTMAEIHYESETVGTPNTHTTH